MAVAQAKIKTVVDGATLTLTHQEARTLRYLMACICGCPKTSARMHTQAIRDALDAAGYGYIPEGDFALGDVAFSDFIPE